MFRIISNKPLRLTRKAPPSTTYLSRSSIQTHRLPHTVLYSTSLTFGMRARRRGTRGGPQGQHLQGSRAVTEGVTEGAQEEAEVKGAAVVGEGGDVVLAVVAAGEEEEEVVVVGATERA